jgi:FkbM family methyltransferase
MLRGAYLYFLGREPERSFDPSNYRSFAHMRHEFLRSDELVSMALNRRFGPAAPRWAMLEFSGGRRLWIDLADAGVSHGVLFAEWEPEVSAWLRRRLRQGDVFLDVGANLGWFTMLAGSLLKEFGGGGRVIGFEPNPRILPRLCDSVAASRLTEIATILPFAVTDAVGAVELHMPRQGHNTGGASLGIPPDIGEYESVTVPSCTLDSFLAVVRRVDFLKLDVEGAERLALDGAKVLLERDHPWIICELNDAALRSVSKCGAMDVVGMLAAYGYKAYDPASERELDVAEVSELIDRLGYPTLIFASARRQGRLP